MASKLRAEAEGVKIGVFHYETKADGLTFQPADIGAVNALPGDIPRNFIAHDFVRVCKFEAGDGLSADVLDFYADVAYNGGGEIDFQRLYH